MAPFFMMQYWRLLVELLPVAGGGDELAEGLAPDDHAVVVGRVHIGREGTMKLSKVFTGPIFTIFSFRRAKSASVSTKVGDR